jgi:hypothetical protein
MTRGIARERISAIDRSGFKMHRFTANLAVSCSVCDKMPTELYWSVDRTMKRAYCAPCFYAMAGKRKPGWLR